MNLIPSVTDYDLFLFVFHPDQLSDTLKEYIAGNSGFNETIEHFRELAMRANEYLNESDIELLMSKIGVYRPAGNIIYLYPNRSQAETKKHPKVVYRAASVEVDEKLTTKTFFDENKLYMVKANINHRTTKIYIFSGTGETLRDITIRIQPGNTLHHLDDNSQPLVLEGRVEVEHLSLEME